MDLIPDQNQIANSRGVVESRPFVCGARDGAFLANGAEQINLWNWIPTSKHVQNPGAAAVQDPTSSATCRLGPSTRKPSQTAWSKYLFARDVEQARHITGRRLH